MSISSDEVNCLIYRYLQENGFHHTAFCFENESLFPRSSVSHIDIPPGALITFLQKGLEYIAIEEHINEDGTVTDFDRNYSLLSPFICDAVATKKDKRHPTSHPQIDHNHTDEVIKSSTESSHESNSNRHIASNETVEGRITSIKSEGGSKWLQLQGHQGEVFMCVWNPVQPQLASGSADGMCRLWGLWQHDPSKWEGDKSTVSIRMATLPHTQTAGERCKDVTSVNWSPDGQLIATGCYDGTARIWDCNGALKMVLLRHSGPVFSLKWNKRGTYLLSGSFDRRAIVWDPETGAVVKIYTMHTAPVLDVDWKDLDTFATCSSDGTIHISSVQAGLNAPVKVFQGHLDEVNAVCWSPGGSLLASCSDDSTAKIWTTTEGLKLDLRGHSKEIYSIRWTPTGPGSNNPDRPLYLCTASFDGAVKVWSPDTGALVFTLRRQSQPVYSVSPSPNGELLATGSLGGHVSLWSLTDGSLIREIRGEGDTFDVSWSPDSSMLCSCFSSGKLYILDARLSVPS